MDDADILNRFTYHRPDADKVIKHESVRGYCLELANRINDLVPDSREKSLAITHIEEVSMWANAAIARKDNS